MQMLESEDTTSSNSLIAMTTHEQVLQWVANIVFSSSLKLTKSIQTTLKTIALGLGDLEVALSGSLHSDQKFKLLRDKLLLQAEHLIQSHLVENGIKVPSYVTTRVIQCQDLALTTEWKLSGTTETAWKLYMSDVADMRNQINPLYENLLKIVGKSKDGHIKAPSGKALIELLDTFYYAVYKMTQKKIVKKDGSSEKSENDESKVHPFAFRSTLFLPDIEEIGGSNFKQSSHTNEDVADSFREDNDSVDGSIDLEKIMNELIIEIEIEIEISENVIQKAPTNKFYYGL